MSNRPAFFSLIVIAMLIAATGSAQVAITYLGNEGVLLEHGPAAIVIDALQGPYKDYPSPPPEMRRKLERAEPPYAGIDLVLVSHVHGDHFNAELIAAHLLNNPGARLVSSDQVVRAVLEQLPPHSAAGRRIEAITPEPGKEISLSHSNAKIRLFGLPHGGREWSEIRNLGHLVELGGVKILHVGDADMDPALYAGFRLGQEKIDVALLPYWFLISEEGRQTIREHIRPKKIIAVHLGVGQEDEVAARVRQVFPDAELFTTIGTKLRADRRFE